MQPRLRRLASHVRARLGMGHRVGGGEATAGQMPPPCPSHCQNEEQQALLASKQGTALLAAAAPGWHEVAVALGGPQDGSAAAATGSRADGSIPKDGGDAPATRPSTASRGGATSRSSCQLASPSLSLPASPRQPRGANVGYSASAGAEAPPLTALRCSSTTGQHHIGGAKATAAAAGSADDGSQGEAWVHVAVHAVASESLCAPPCATRPTSPIAAGAASAGVRD